MKSTSSGLLRLALAATCLGYLHGDASAQLLPARWTTLPSPNPGDWGNQLYGVGGTGPNDVWAVGTYASASSGSRSLALHWDGEAWMHVPTPTPFVGDLIRAVSAAAPDDVWAIGGHGLPYAFHYDGGQWSASLLPQPGQFGSGIAVSDVVALSSDDVWAVGWYDLTGTAQLRTAVWHWDGNAWTVVPSPSAPNTSGGAYPSMLLSVSAANPDEVFAVGEWRIGNNWYPLVLRYDGMRWRLQNAPSSPSGDGRLRAVSARAANDVWAVGTSNDHAVVIGGGYGDPFAMHFDGNAWSVVAAPQPSVWGATALRSVIALRDRVVAVGCFENATQGLDTLILQLDRDAGVFSVVPSTNIPGNGEGWNELFDVGGFGAEIWTIGHGSVVFPGSSQFFTLVERAVSVPRRRAGP